MPLFKLGEVPFEPEREIWTNIVTLGAIEIEDYVYYIPEDLTNEVCVYETQADGSYISET